MGKKAARTYFCLLCKHSFVQDDEVVEMRSYLAELPDGKEEEDDGPWLRQDWVHAGCWRLRLADQEAVARARLLLGERMKVRDE